MFKVCGTTVGALMKRATATRSVVGGTKKYVVLVCVCPLFALPSFFASF